MGKKKKKKQRGCCNHWRISRFEPAMKSLEVSRSKGKLWSSLRYRGRWGDGDGEERLQLENLEKRGSRSNRLEWLEGEDERGSRFWNKWKGGNEKSWAPISQKPSLYKKCGNLWIYFDDLMVVKTLLTYNVRTVPTWIFLVYIYIYNMRDAPMRDISHLIWEGGGTHILVVGIGYGCEGPYPISHLR